MRVSTICRMWLQTPFVRYDGMANKTAVKVRCLCPVLAHRLRPRTYMLPLDKSHIAGIWGQTTDSLSWSNKPYHCLCSNAHKTLLRIQWIAVNILELSVVDGDECGAPRTPGNGWERDWKRDEWLICAPHYWLWWRWASIQLLLIRLLCD